MHRDSKGESIYLAEPDKHFPELSVGQTLSFAASTRETDKNSTAVSQATGREVSVLFEFPNAFDTKMGNDLIRGVSEGETRRTSIAEALLSRAQFQCWEYSARGLDSFTAQKFITLLKKSTKALRSTVVMRIYQRSNAMYHSFDKVTVLYEGRQIYFGPVDSATDYFHKLGFAKDNRATTPDFLTSLTSPAERIVRQGFEGQTPRSLEDAERKRLIEDIKVFNSSRSLKISIGAGTYSITSSDLMKDMLDNRSATYPIPISQQILICLPRGLLLLRNNYIPAVSTVFANAILAIVVDSVFHDLPDTRVSMDQRAVLTMWAQRPIVEKQNRYAFYYPFTEAVAAIICDFPVKVGTTFMFHVTLYFMTNLRRTASTFFTYVLFTFFIVLTMSMVLRTLGSLSRTLE
ncbi:hypothetical protein sscle_02g019540 [Sclerotinia sclerotiorum 1980 UF-70]|uniref:ABC-2 type transporter transmembrane domain-containing protein n=1 Tax=Sclerotinia sclerotiorum (strain ATCC 18683 / 1980 / Ss-1) TaxID=665079 RepID=A0A1D9PWW3_SCLS1|nr:hypothetical protein sscle_02g019540 [Sclerotinia sclerotiorum 1980 UF-70]